MRVLAGTYDADRNVITASIDSERWTVPLAPGRPTTPGHDAPIAIENHDRTLTIAYSSTGSRGDVRVVLVTHMRRPGILNPPAKISEPLTAHTSAAALERAAQTWDPLRSLHGELAFTPDHGE